MDERFLIAQNIVFDIGGVLLSFCPEKVCTLLPEDIRQDVYNAMFRQEWGQSRWAQFDLGKKSNMEIASDIAAATAHPGCEKHILQLLETFPQTMSPLPLSHLIAELKAMGKRVFALTNYPEPSLTRTVERFAFFRHMDGMVVSSREKVMKPDERIYRILLDRYHLNAEDTLFIDDRLENIRAAEKLGIQGWHYIP